MTEAAQTALAGLRPDVTEPTGLMVRLSALSDADCAEIARRVRALEPQWDRRQWRGTFTIGRAIYADAAHGADARRNYHEHLPRTNALLRERFGDLLELVAARLRRHLDAPVELYGGAALPGFHIFAGPGIPVGEHGKPHFDLQHRYVAWPAPPEEDMLLSFTLPIQVPREGAGMDLWDLTQPAYRLASDGGTRAQEDALRETPMVRTPYAPGWLYVQSRMLLHRIAGVARVHPDDLRISLQGHAARIDGVWQLYW